MYLDAAKIASIASNNNVREDQDGMIAAVLAEVAKAVPYAVAHVPTSGEVSGGSFDVVAPTAPTSVIVNVLVTATGVAKAWDGAISISGSTITIDNTGSVDWDVNDTVHVISLP